MTQSDRPEPRRSGLAIRVGAYRSGRATSRVTARHERAGDGGVVHEGDATRLGVADEEPGIGTVSPQRPSLSLSLFLSIPNGDSHPRAPSDTPRDRERRSIASRHRQSARVNRRPVSDNAMLARLETMRQAPMDAAIPRVSEANRTATAYSARVFVCLSIKLADPSGRFAPTAKHHCSTNTGNEGGMGKFNRSRFKTRDRTRSIAASSAPRVSPLPASA